MSETFGDLIRVNPNSAKRLERLLTVTDSKAETISTPAYQDAKYELNHICEELFFCNGPYYNHDLWFTSSSQAANRIKLAEKMRKKSWDASLSTFIAAALEVQMLHNTLVDLKNKVVKRQIRSEAERAEDYVPPIPTTEAATKVNAILKTMTDDLTLQYEDILYKWFVTDVQIMMANPRKRGDKTMMSLCEMMLMPKVGDDYDNFNGCYTSLKADWKEILRQKAKADADFAQRQFLYKNVMKLATIIEKKKNFTEHKINYGRVNHNGFMGEIVFNFADKSSFVVRNKVVVKYSVHGKCFQQFPTTFHAAMLPTSTVMPGQPSEKEMIEIFAEAK